MIPSFYPEIQALQRLRQQYHIKIKVSKNDFPKGVPSLVKVVLRIGQQEFELLVEDEYNDFVIGNPLLDLCLVLRELEDYKETADYLDWCRAKGIDAANDHVRTFHLNLRTLLPEIEALIGPVDSCIPSLDFQLNAGAAQFLRNYPAEDAD